MVANAAHLIRNQQKQKLNLFTLKKKKMKRRPKIALFLVVTILTAGTLFATVGRHHHFCGYQTECKQMKGDKHHACNQDEESVTEVEPAN